MDSGPLRPRSHHICDEGRTSVPRRLDVLKTRSRITRLDDIGDPLGRNQYVASRDQFSYFLPVDLADVESKRHPTPRSNIRRKVESRGAGSSQCGVLVWQHFATDSDNAVAMMVVEIIRKGFFADKEIRCCPLSWRVVWKCKADLRKMRESSIFHTRLKAAQNTKYSAPQLLPHIAFRRP